MSQNSHAPFLVAFTGMVSTSVALILLVPALFDSPGTGRMVVAGVLGVLVLAFAITARRVRLPSSDQSAGA